MFPLVLLGVPGFSLGTGTGGCRGGVAGDLGGAGTGGPEVGVETCSCLIGIIMFGGVPNGWACTAGKFVRAGGAGTAGFVIGGAFDMRAGVDGGG